MGTLSTDLQQLGYEPTDRDSPFDEDGQLWTNSFELVCDQTGRVIRKDSSRNRSSSTTITDETAHTYRHSETVKLYGGYVRPYFESDGLY